MPILFKTMISDSTLHGRGIVALEDIPEGATWWVYDDRIAAPPVENWQVTPNIAFDQKSFEEFAQTHSREEIVKLLDHTMNYEAAGLLLYFGDGSGVLNHSEDFNSQIVFNEDKDPRQLRSIATRYIKAGEEIT